MRTAREKDGGADKRPRAIKGKEAGMRRFGRVFLIVLGFLCLAGCGKGAGAAGQRSEKGYGFAEVMIIAGTEKNRYEAIFSDQIWAVPAGADGSDFASYLKDQIRQFMDELRLISRMAKDRGIELSAEERSAMAGAAQAYYERLSEADREYMELTLEDVQGLYEDYCLAEKAVEELTGGLALEVSDSEAQVADLLLAQTPDRQTADRLVADASQEGADFESCAMALGMTVTEKKLGKGEDAALDAAAFSLADGQLGPVVETDGVFTVLYCETAYDAEATDARKEAIFEERKKRAFDEIYEEYRDGVVLTYADSLWERVDLSAQGWAENADFFEIYQESAGRL